MKPQIRGVRSVEIELADPTRAASFYSEIWNLEEIPSAGGSRHFRGTGAAHQILAIYPAAGVPAIRRVVLDATDREAVGELHRNVSRRTDLVEGPRELEGPNGGYGFGFKDPEGRNFAVVCDAAGRNPPPGAAVPDRPTKISHVNFNTADIESTTRFFVDALGFRVIDTTPALTFFHCDGSDHNAIVAAKASGPALNHIAFEMPDLESVMRGAGRMRDHGYPIEWGVGRHGPGNNVFAYFAGPEEMPIEYTGEMEQVDNSYVSHGPDYWKFPPGRSDRWGVTGPPSARLKRVQNMFRFTQDGYRLSPGF